MSAPAPTTSASSSRTRLSTRTRRLIGAGVIVAVLIAMALGTRVVSADDPLAAGEVVFNAETFGEENFATVQEGVIDRAVEAADLAAAISEDAAAAAAEYAVESSGGPVYSVTFTGVVREGQSGIYAVDVEGLPDDLLLRVQTGPAINGTELRDATGAFEFGQFTNQIAYQNAAAALNDQVKLQVLADLDTENLTGATVTVTGAFTLVNPSAWLVTPVEMDIS